MYFVYGDRGVGMVQEGPLRHEDTVAFLAMDFPEAIYFEAELVAPEETDPWIVRTFNKDLIGLNEVGRPCEVCNRKMRDHEWVDLNLNGFAVACSFGS